MSGDRQAAFSIDLQVLDCWSPRAFDGVCVSDAELMSLFAAARRVPSAFNVQPWRFRYTVPRGEWWMRFLGVLILFKRSWAWQASARAVRRADDGAGWHIQAIAQPQFRCRFGLGLLALQARRLGLYTYAMTGIDFGAARAVLDVPKRYGIECAIAAGQIGNATSLSKELRATEMSSGRQPVFEFAFNGAFAVADA